MWQRATSLEKLDNQPMMDVRNWFFVRTKLRLNVVALAL